MRPIRDIFLAHALVENGKLVRGCDKAVYHNYGDAYERIIDSMRTGPAFVRNCVKYMMEVGIAEGDSLLAWSEVFSNATIVGLDVRSSIRAAGERIEFHQGNMASRADCDRAANCRQFDLIVEDASHYLPDTLIALLHLWKWVKPGGLYVIEEWLGVDGIRDYVSELFPFAEIVDTAGPFGNNEPLVVFRKPL